jgi:hypothetical protein
MPWARAYAIVKDDASGLENLENRTRKGHIGWGWTYARNPANFPQLVFL